MPETASFVSLTRTAFKDILQNRSTWWIAFPVGSLAALSSFFASRAEKLIEGKEGALLSSWLTTGPDTPFLFCFVLGLAFTLAQTPFRGLIVTLLQSSRLSQSASLGHSSPKRRICFRAAVVAFLFEAGFWLILGAFGLIFFFPGLLAWKFNREAFAFVSEIGLLSLLGLALYLYLIKELSLLYKLLGKTSSRSAIDLGFRIFRRHSFLTLLFYTYLSMLALMSTLCISIFIELLPLSISNGFSSLVKSLLTIPFFGFYFIFDHTLRLVYFRSIASPPKTPSAEGVVAKPAEPAAEMTKS